MSKKNKKLLVPKLRFPEFQDSGDWDYPNGNNLFEPIVNKDHNSDLPILAITQEYGAIPRYMIDYHISVTEKSIESYKVVEIGDFIISLRSFQGGIEYSAYKGICSPAYIILRKRSDKIKNHFYRFYFKSDRFIKDLNRNIEGIRDGKMVSYAQFSELSFPFPDYSEQQKIADCLTSLDELIAAEVNKLEAYKAHKKGLMQKIFPAEGKTVPEWRFPEFQGKGEWNVKKIDEIKLFLTDYVANGSFKSLRENLNVLETVDYAYYVRLTDLRAGIGHLNQKYVDKNTYLFLNKSSLFGGELLMANIGANVGEVWQMPFVDKPATLAPNMILIKFTPDIDSRFIYNFLTSDIGIENISTAISGSGHPKISKTDLKKVDILLPPTLKEQQKIAGCLSALDELIIAQTHKIETLANHKKGLMQGLFPSADEVGV